MESKAKPDFKTQREETLSQMKANLPEYVVNCLVAAGFDTSMALATLDLSDKPGNSIDGIRQFISRKHPGDAKFKSDESSDVADFLPGHINLIKEFVKEVNRVPLKRRSTGSIPLSKKRATTCAQAAQLDDEEEQPIQLDRVAANLRQQIAAWQRKQKEDWLRNLKENEDFEVHVKLTKAGTTCSASVECKRGTLFTSLTNSLIKLICPGRKSATSEDSSDLNLASPGCFLLMNCLMPSIELPGLSLRSSVANAILVSKPAATKQLTTYSGRLAFI